MNQILVSEKLYVTPDMKKKKKIFRIEFFLSVFLLCVLSSYAIYAEYDRNKSEQVSKEILEGISYNDKQNENSSNGAVRVEDDAIVVILNQALADNEEVSINELTQPQSQTVQPEQVSVASDGTEYYTIGVVNIPSISVNYPILTTNTPEHLDTILKISVCKFHGANPNEVGNLCIVGHNYRSSKFFSKVPNLNLGDIIEITDLNGRTLKYSVYDKYIVEPDNVACTSQLTDGRKEVTLITCTNDNKQRHIIKAREV